MYEQNENGNKWQNVTKISSKEIMELKSTITEILKNILEGFKSRSEQREKIHKSIKVRTD